MKKKLSVILMGSVLALAITGCSAKVTPPSGAAEPTGSSVSDTADTSSEEPSAEEEEQEISLQSETAEPSDTASSSSDNSTVSVSEPSSPVSSQSGSHSSDAASSSSAPEPSEEVTVSDTGNDYLSYSTDFVDLSDKEITAQKTDLSSVKCFKITDKAALEDFYKTNAAAYALDKVDTGNTFGELARTFDESYMNHYCLVIILTQHKTGSEVDTGIARIVDGKLNIVLYAEQPKEKDKTSYTCIITGFDKNQVGSAEPQIELIDSDGIDDETGEP